METKHTAGKWRVRVGEFPVGHPGRIVVSSPNRCVCAIHQSERAKGMADAALIAAAPDLLKACTKMVGIINGWLAYCDEQERKDSFAAWVTASDEAEAAIAKATA